MKNINLKKNHFYLIILLTTLVSYFNTAKHDFVLDDDVVFIKNSFVQEGVSAIPDILSHGFLYGFNQKNDQSYRPLVLINFAIEKSIFGNNSSALHILNMLYYALLCCILFNFLSLLFKQEQPWIAFWITLLFIVHPVHTEVVANIKGRDEILHAIFLILSFTYALKYVDEQKARPIAFSLLFFFCALLCKEMAVTYIALLPLTLWVFRDLKIKQIAITTSYFGGVLLAYFLLRNAILDTITFEEKMKVINNGLAAAENYPDQLATTFLIFGNYVKLLFFPSPLSWDYSYPHFPIVSFGNPTVIVVLIALLTIGVIALLKLPAKSKIAYTFFFFIISFSIVSNFFILIGSTMGERFLFFPSIAFCIFVVLVLKMLTEKMKKNKTNVLTATVLLISIAFMLKTIDRNKDWENNISLFLAGAEATPNNSRAISALATVHRLSGEQSKTQADQLKYYTKAINAYKRSIQLLPGNSDAHYNLGVVYMATGQDDKAKVSFQNVINLEPTNVNALNNLGVIYFRSFQFQQAIPLFEKCLEVNPNFQNAIANLGAVYHNEGNLGKAQQYYLRALELNPNDVNTRNNLGKLQ